jgi:branched-chain amino acid aminotransferase
VTSSSETAEVEKAGAGGDAAARDRWTVREARPADAGRCAAAVTELLRELGGTPPEKGAMDAAAAELIAEEDAGTLLMALSEEGALVGILAVNWLKAIHAAGTFCLIQDLWVHPQWRSRGVGAGLIETLRRAALAREVARIEVGLPREGWPGLAATEAFYERNGFEAIGPRMRLAVGEP